MLCLLRVIGLVAHWLIGSVAQCFAGLLVFELHFEAAPCRESSQRRANDLLASLEDHRLLIAFGIEEAERQVVVPFLGEQEERRDRYRQTEATG